MVLLHDDANFLHEVNGGLSSMVQMLKILAVLTIVGAVLPLIIRHYRTETLATKFKELGNMWGLTKGEIIQLVGSPTSIQVIGSEQLAIWKSPGYAISLVFDSEDRFLRVQSEYGRASKLL